MNVILGIGYTLSPQCSDIMALRCLRLMMETLTTDNRGIALSAQPLGLGDCSKNMVYVSYYGRISNTAKLLRIIHLLLFS